MAKEVTREELKQLIQDALDEGLETKEIADKFNEEYGDDNAKLSAADITKLKELVGLKGAKPKKKRSQVFKIVDEPVEEAIAEEAPMPEAEYPVYHHSDDVIEEPEYVEQF